MLFLGQLLQHYYIYVQNISVGFFYIARVFLHFFLKPGIS